MSRNLYLFGQPNTLRQSIKTMDGSARINWNWNNEQNRYIVSNEPAFNMSIPIVSDPYFSIRYANSGIKNQNISWNNHLTIKQNGNVGISVVDPQYRFDVDGSLSCNDINIKNDNSLNSIRSVLNNLQTNINSVQTIVTQMQPIVTQMQNANDMYIFDRMKKASSQICFIINGSQYIGSGWYYANSPQHLQYGYFVTAAHCVSGVTNNVFYRASSIYVQNPITDSWISVDISNVYIDGIGDIAVLKTNIDFTNYPTYCLKITDGIPRAGEKCYVIGNPGGQDEDSISVGCIRDPKYNDPYGYQVPESMYVNCPGIGGNSGGPIVNVSGDVIGIFTFGQTNNECFGGGANNFTLLKSLPILLSGVDNKQKRYIGLDWELASPYRIRTFYNNTNSFPTYGVFIWSVSSASPFFGILAANDFLLDCSINSTGEYFKFGRNDGEKSPGALIYYYSDIVITVNYIKANTKNIQTAIITLNKTYNDVSATLDVPLNTALREFVNIRTSTIREI